MNPDNLAFSLYIKSRSKFRRLNKKEEKIVKKEPSVAVAYAAEILKKRWFDAEIYIVSSSLAMLQYSKNPIRGKLPERLHNQMIINAMNGCYHAKRYLNETTNNQIKLRR